MMGRDFTRGSWNPGGRAVVSVGFLLMGRRRRKAAWEILRDGEGCATTGVDLEDVMGSEVSQTQEDRYCMISFVSGI